MDERKKERFIEMEVLTGQVACMNHVINQGWYFDCNDGRRHDLTPNGADVLKALIASVNIRLKFLEEYSGLSFDQDKEEC